MESKFKINFLFKNTIISLLKSKSNTISNGKNYIKNFLNLAKNFTFNKKNLFLFLNSSLFFTYLKNSKKIVYAQTNEENKIIPLEERVNVINFSANTPIEDRFNAIRLKNIEGNLLAVFDGHGGDSISEYASQKIAPYLDSIYLELMNNKNNKDKTKDQLISQALYDTFQKIVN
jgi:hypothetical protein